MLFCFMVVLGTTYATRAFADSIRGFVTFHEKQVYLLPLSQTEPMRRLSISTSFVNRVALMELKAGDFVVLAGTLVDSDQDGTQDQVVVQAIESVGLGDFLGTWRSPRGQVMRVENFNSISLYRPEFGAFETGSAVGLAKIKDLRYTLAPESGAAYSIFLAEKQAHLSQPAAVYIGRIKLNHDLPENQLTLEIFDPKTGQPAEVISLSLVRD